MREENCVTRVCGGGKKKKEEANNHPSGDVSRDGYVLVRYTASANLLFVTHMSRKASRESLMSANLSVSGVISFVRRPSPGKPWPHPNLET